MTESQQPEIRELDARTVERIAAGEVVERPASVVKELVENSIDADASSVTVGVERGGIDGIQVSDDGVGMTESALRRAVEKHTTSKIGDIDDLEGGVGTLGFRGEALHAIGAVSRMTITSRPRGGDHGTELTVEGGEVTDVSPAGCPEGTTVTIRDLFYNVPARRKYLKQESTEFSHVNRVVTSYALANPEIAVSLEHDGRETFATTGQDNLRATVLSVYGREVAEGMVDLSGSGLPAGPLDGVSGLVSDPETTRATREYLSTFVNGRYVTAGSVREAVVDAYGKQLAADRYPFAVLFLDVDPGTVDVNVHPRKLEVRFADEQGVREQVRTVVKGALLDEGLLRSSAPRGRSAPDQTEIQPSRFSDASGETRPEKDGEAADESDADARDGDSTEETAAKTSSRPEGTASAGSKKREGQDPTITTRTIDADAYPDKSGGQSEGRSHPSADEGDDPPASKPGEGSTSPASAPVDERTQTERGESPEGDESGRDRDKFRETGRQERLGAGDTDVAFQQLPAMRILGQFHDTYVVAETSDGLVLIDQHAADERVNYERLRDSFAGETTTQALAEPVGVEVTAREAELFAAHAEALARLGFHAELIDDRRLEVTTVPSLVGETADPTLIREVLGEFVSGEAAAAGTVEEAADSLLADLACYPSITGNTPLTEGSVVDLLERLDECENPYACPHGRPVVIEIDSEEIENRFERDYPGHQ